MAKMQGLTGKMSGKMGSVVFRVRQGEQIVTQYNPIVKNPNTEDQSTQRGKFKLMSQVAAALASAIINRPARQGQSPRNRFVQQNFPLVETERDIAKVAMEQLQLTSSSTYLGTIAATNNSVTISNIPANVESVQFVTISYPQAGDKTKPVVSKIDIVDVSSGSATLNANAGTTILAYGLIPTSSAAKTTLENMAVDPSEPYLAQTNIVRLVNEGNLAVTETLGTNVSNDA